MYPNPQDALPLPPQPNIDQYRKLAKDLVKACRTGDASAMGDWARHWVESLVALHAATTSLRKDIDARSVAEDIAQFAVKKLRSKNDQASAACVLADAQFVIARAHGFLSWPRFKQTLQTLALAHSGVSAFEAAANAIVTGDLSTLTGLLREHPELVHARSTREHGATLLHYVSANGVENFRQISPKNVPASTELLLRSGADVDATAHVYESECTTLGLVATSGPPAAAGVQLPIIDMLLNYHARMDLPGGAGRDHSLIRSCLANGQPEAAEYLVARGAPLDFVGAAGLGRLDVVRTHFDLETASSARPTERQLREAFYLASAYGRAPVVELLLRQGIDAEVELDGHGEGHTALHVAAYHGHVEVVDVLLRHGASIDAIDKTWRTPPLLWALAGWTRGDARDDESSYIVVARLVAAGAQVRPDVLEWEKVRGDANMREALRGIASA